MSEEDTQGEAAESSLDRLVERLRESDLAHVGDPDDKPAAAVAKFLLSEKYKGPFPHPTVLRGLNEVVQNGAERAFALTEKEQAHRHQCDLKMINAEINEMNRIATDRRLIIIIASVIFAGALTASFVAAMLGRPWTSGISALVAAIVGLAGIVKIRRPQKEDNKGE